MLSLGAHKMHTMHLENVIGVHYYFIIILRMRQNKIRTHINIRYIYNINCERIILQIATTTKRYNPKNKRNCKQQFAVCGFCILWRRKNKHRMWLNRLIFEQEINAHYSNAKGEMPNFILSPFLHFGPCLLLLRFCCRRS